MKKWIFLLCAIIAFSALVFMDFRSPPREAFQISGSLINLGGQMKRTFPNGLPVNVVFADAIRNKIKFTKSPKNEDIPVLMSAGYDLYDCNMENSQVKYYSLEKRVVCWKRVFSLNGYHYVMLFSDWTTEMTRDTSKMPKTTLINK